MHLQRLRGRTAQTMVVCALILLVQNLAVFFRHYFEGRAFPDDFLLTYHAIPYYWIEALKHGKEISWIPFQVMGYPLYMNLQSGYLYLPLRMFVWLDGVYSVHAAVILQGAHVFCGALGALVCSRLGGARWGPALLAGALYQCFGGFYSNAQHPDIVRSFCFLPWLCAPVFADWRQGGRLFAMCTAALPIWIYAQWTGGYPGAAVASTLLLGAITVLRIVAERSEWRTGLLVLVAQAVGILVAGVGIVPAALDARLIDRSMQLGRLDYDYLQLRDVLALAFPVDGSYFSHDLSMRSLFIAVPGLALLLAASGRIRQLPKWPLLCALLALLIAAGPLHRLLVTLVPPAGLSRFVMADYRGFVALGLILSGVQLVQVAPVRMTGFRIWPLVLAGLLIMGLQVLGWERSYASEDRIAQAMLLLVALGCSAPALQSRLAGVEVNAALVAGIAAVYLYQNYVSMLLPAASGALLWVLICFGAFTLVVLSVGRLRRRLELTTLSAWLLIALYLVYLAHVVRPDRNGQAVALSVLASATLLALASHPVRRLRSQGLALLMVLTVLDWARVTWDQNYFAPPVQDGTPWIESVTGPFDLTHEALVSRLTSDTCRGARRDMPPPLIERAPWAGYYTGEFYLQDHAVQLAPQRKVLADPALKSFAQLPWRMVALPDGSALATADQLAAAIPASGATCLAWDTAAATYVVELAKPQLLVENEIFWDGWSATLVCRAGCLSGATLDLRAIAVLGFRGWQLPAGRWEMRTHFVPPHRTLAWSVTLGGLVAWLVLCWQLGHSAARRRPEEELRIGA